MFATNAKVQDNPWLAWTFVVAGGGFEPPTSGSFIGSPGHYRTILETTDFLIDSGEILVLAFPMLHDHSRL
jgi:hypothetical protein